MRRLFVPLTVLILVFAATSTARAAGNTITVNTTADDQTNNGNCTLREAIMAANSDAPVDACSAGSGTDTIAFNIGGGGVQTISPTSNLPTITSPVVIDGTTQPGSNGKPGIVLDGTSAAGSATGLWITGGSSTVRGLVIDGFSWRAIYLNLGGGNTIAGNYIGLNAAGTAAAAVGNAYGVQIEYSNNNQVGGTTAADRNVIAGNSNDAIQVYSGDSSHPSTGTVISGNYIGTSANGMSRIGNNIGIEIWPHVTNTTIGGTAPGSGNVVVSTGAGIQLLGDSNVVQGNIVGLAANGITVMGNNMCGVCIGGDNNLVGGTTAAARNIISGNGYQSAGVPVPITNGNGIQFSAGADNNTIQGNYIGTDITGTLRRDNLGAGIYLFNGDTGNTIGGTAAGAGNLISGNDKSGIELAYGGNQNNVIQGNLIGTDKTGTTALANGQDGIRLNLSAWNNTVGGNTPQARNIISGNAGFGIRLQSDARANVVSGNYIGTTISGSSALPNQSGGVVIVDTNTAPNDPTLDNVIGGTAAGAGNVISGNANAGIVVLGGYVRQNTIQGNIIGPDASGTAAIAGQPTGISLSGVPGIVIGGPSALAGNLISGNTSTGINVSFTTFDRGNLVTIIGNRVGVDESGSIALPNGNTGISLTNADAYLADNLVAFHTGSGVSSTGGELIGSTNNCIQGNATGLTLYSQPQTDVTYNWWGAASGPQLSSNPSGTGDQISGNAADLQSVLFNPFLTSAPSAGCGVGTPQVPAPDSPSVTPVSGGRIDLTWADNSSDETGFRIQRAAGNGSWVNIATVPANSTQYSDTSVICETAYFYRVFADRSTDHHVSAPSEEASAATLSCPGAPSGLSLMVDGLTTINLNWTDGSSDETNFRVERSDNGTSGWSQIGTAAANTPSYSDDSLTCSTTRYYRVRAYRSGDGQYSTYSNVNHAKTDACPPLSTPGGLTAAASGVDTINLSWTDASSGETNFRVEGSDDGLGGWSQIGTAAANTPSYSDATLICNTTRYYRVRAYRASDGEYSDYSNVDHATTDACPAPSVDVSPHEVKFGPLIINQTSPAQPVTLTNSGDGILHVDQMTVSADFALSADLCSNQDVTPNGGTCTFAVTFHPATAGGKSGSVTIPTNAGAASVSLSGTGLSKLAAPKLTAPKNGALVYTQKVKLSWGSVTGAKGYRVEVGTDSGFVNPLAQSGNPTGATFTTKALAFGIYWWHVATKDASGQGVYSKPFKFEVTLNKTPAKNATVATGQVKFAWQAVSGKSYTLQYGDDPAFLSGDTVKLSTGKTATYTIPKAKALAGGHKTYYWRVSVDGGKTWTPYWAFIVK